MIEFPKKRIRRSLADVYHYIILITVHVGVELASTLSSQGGGELRPYANFYLIGTGMKQRIKIKKDI